MAQRSQFSPGGLFRERSSTNYAERVIRIRFTIELLNLFFLTDFVFACFTTFAFEFFSLCSIAFFSAVLVSIMLKNIESMNIYYATKLVF